MHNDLRRTIRHYLAQHLLDNLNPRHRLPAIMGTSAAEVKINPTMPNPANKWGPMRFMLLLM
jgi:hypothetical protein